MNSSSIHADFVCLSQDMEIAEPTLLVKLPRAGPSEEGSRRFSQVYGVRDGKSKKRHEICAAVDGNSLNIFEVGWSHSAKDIELIVRFR